MKTKTPPQPVPLPDYGTWLHGDTGTEKYIIRGAMLAKWPPADFENILDVGTGRGIIGIGYAKHNASVHVVGIDIWQEEAIRDNSPQWVSENARRENTHTRVRSLTARAERLPFCSGCFDRVVSSMCLHNIQSTHAQLHAFEEIARVLRPGGMFIYVDVRWDARWSRVRARLDSLNLQVLSDDVITTSGRATTGVGFIGARKRGGRK